MHGDEGAGVVAAEQVRDWPLRTGRLVVLPRANARAVAAGTRRAPGSPPGTGDLNRDFPDATAAVVGRGAGSPSGPRSAEAAAIWALVRAYRPDWIVDLHEGEAARRADRTRDGNSVIAHPDQPDALAVADAMVEAVNATIDDPPVRYLRLTQRTRTTFVRSAADHFGARTLLLETTQNGPPLSRRAWRHRLLVHLLLAHLGMLDPAVRVADVLPRERAPGEVRVAVYDAEGTDAKGLVLALAAVEAAEVTRVVRVGTEDLRGGALDLVDAVVFRTGDLRARFRALGAEGGARLGAFVAAGGRLGRPDGILPAGVLEGTAVSGRPGRGSRTRAPR
jgi:predicted deacylase